MNKKIYVSILLSTILLSSKLSALDNLIWDRGVSSEGAYYTPTTPTAAKTDPSKDKSSLKYKVSESVAGVRLLTNEAKLQQEKSIKDFNRNFDNDLIKAETQTIRPASSSWSLVNSNCEFEPEFAFEDSLDRFQNQLGELLTGIAGNASIWLMNKGMSLACEKTAEQYCETFGGYMNYMDMKAVSSKISECMNKHTKHTINTQSGTKTGIVWVGCDVEPGQGVAPPVVMFPYCANTTNITLQCPKSVPPIPRCTPYMPLPQADGNTDTVMDAKALGYAATCNNQHYDMEKAPAIKKCKLSTAKKCMDFVNMSTNKGLDFGLMDLNMQNQSCQLDKEYIDATEAAMLIESSEGRYLPNNKIMENGKVVINNKDEPQTAFMLNKKEMTKLTGETAGNSVSQELSGLKDKASAIVNNGNSSQYEKQVALQKLKKDQEELKKLYDSMLASTDDMGKLDSIVLKEMEAMNHVFFDNPDLNIMKYNIFTKYIAERKNIMTAKYFGYRSYDQTFFTDNMEKFPSEIDKINEELDFYDKLFQSEVNRFDPLQKSVEEQINTYQLDKNEKASYNVISK
jgi:hypothetical protein